MLSDHEHVIDCIAWANSEAARIIENATYNGVGVFTYLSVLPDALLRIWSCVLGEISHEIEVLPHRVGDASHEA